jgi:hypothetical protein
MAISISVTAAALDALDLSPVTTVVEQWLTAGVVVDQEQQVQFAIAYPQEPGDPRELPEIPEIRLWFIRLDALYPWLPFVLNWQTGELVRYTAMLVPHQFHPKDGVIYNPEALEIFVMSKVFTLAIWLRQQGIEGTSRLRAMTQMLGYELDDSFFELL